MDQLLNKPLFILIALWLLNDPKGVNWKERRLHLYAVRESLPEPPKKLRYLADVLERLTIWLVKDWITRELEAMDRLQDLGSHGVIILQDE